MPRQRDRQSTAASVNWESLRLEDRLGAGMRVLFVGINPGVRSATIGHHFAGFSNRFWKLLCESRLVPERITYEDDDRLPEWGFGITNIVARPSAGIEDFVCIDSGSPGTTLSSTWACWRPRSPEPA